MKPGDGLVGHVVGQVVVLALGHADDALVLGDERVVLPALPAEEAPEVVESPGTGPTVERPRRSLFVIRGEVPFADGCGGVAVALQDLRKRRRVLGGEAAVAGEAGRRLGHGTEGDGVMVAPGQEGRPRGRAQCGHVEVVVAEPTVREAGERRACRSAPPKVLGLPKPASSMSTSRTFGAPFGGSTAVTMFQSGTDPSSVRWIVPVNVGSAIGKTERSTSSLIGISSMAGGGTIAKQ